MSMDLSQGFGTLASLQRRGLGVLGPLGNAATLDPDEYQVTGDGVYLWNGSQSDAGSIAMLNTGDRVTASGTVTLDVGNGKYYAKVLSDKAPNAPEAWIAVEYLAPLSWQRPAAPPPAAPPPSDNKTPNAMLPAGKTNYTMPVLIGIGVLGLSAIGYALFRKKKGHRRA
jgi:hypothetical protein